MHNTLFRSSLSSHAVLAIALLVAFFMLAACGEGEDTTGDQDTNQTGDGETGDGATGDGATGDGATGDGETGDGETGDGETGDGETGDGETLAPEFSQCGGFIPRPNSVPELAVDCAECVDEECCDQAAACGDDADCLALRECFIDCDPGDRACESQCSDTHSAGRTMNGPFITCRNSACSMVCREAFNWTCIGNQATPPVVEPQDITLTITLVDFQTGAAVSGADVKFCSRDDHDCDSPLATTTSDSTGGLSVTIDRGTTGFDGYMEITGADRFPTLGYFNSTAFEDSTASAFAVLSTTTFGQFGGILGITADATRGHIAVIAQDCSGRAAADITISASGADAETTLAYLSGGLPSSNVTATDFSGVGGIFNVPAGSLTFEAARQEDQVVVISSDLVVRPGHITTAPGLPNQ